MHHESDLGTIISALSGAEILLRGHSSSGRLDAELLLGKVLKQPRLYLHAHLRDALPVQSQRTFSSLVRRRVEGVPLAYLTGEKEFSGRPFHITPAVLVPRPETEGVVEAALRLLEELHESHPIVVDLGTGAGVIGISIAAETPRTYAVVTDRSAAALEVARRNARKHKVFRRMSFLESDLLSEIPPEMTPDVLVANLPYVPSDDLKHAGASPETRGLLFEPQKALDGGPDGLFIIRRLFAQLKRFRDQSLVSSLQHLILEHSPAQRKLIQELAHEALPTFRPHEVTPFVTSWKKINNFRS